MKSNVFLLYATRPNKYRYTARLAFYCTVERSPSSSLVLQAYDKILTIENTRLSTNEDIPVN